MTAQRQKDPAKVLLKRVRLSFGDIFEAKAFGDDPNSEPQFSANFLIDPETQRGAANISAMESAIKFVTAEKWPKGAPKLPDAKKCLRSGDDMEYDGYEGMMFVSANNKKRPLILDLDKEELLRDDGTIYSGCYVDAIVRVWGQDNKYGKRVNASLEAVRFIADGEPFGASRASADDFDEDDEDEGEPPKRKRRPAEDEDEDEPPKRKRRPAEDEDEDEPPKRKRRPAEDEDEDEPPKRKSRPSEHDDVDRPPKNSRSRRRADDDDDVPY